MVFRPDLSSGARQRTCSILAALLLACNGAMAAIYKSVDEQGRVTYTDHAPEDAEEVAVEPPNTLPAFEEPEAPPPPLMLPGANGGMGPPSVRIMSPQPEQHFHNPGEEGITVSIQVEHADELVVEILHNGKVVATGATTFVLQQPDRGEHVFLARILDQNGRVLVTSQSVTIYVHRSTVFSNPASTYRKELAARQAREAARRPLWRRAIPFL